MKETVREIIVTNEEETRQFALDLAKELKPGDIIGLIGDLGTGKTAMTRYLAEGIGIHARVNSPTFTIVKEYHDGIMPLYHFDIYRVSDYDELFNIGFEEYLYGEGGHRKGLSVVEWADLIEDDMPEETKLIYIEYCGEQNNESCGVQGVNSGEQSIDGIEQGVMEGRKIKCTF